MKFSIITVCYNSAKTINDTLLSVKDQCFDDVEYIVCDGYSKDNTNYIVENYSDIVSKHIIEKDKGIYDAINKGISLSSGDVVAILNSDDFYINGYVIEMVSRIFDENPDVDMVLGNVDFVSDKDLRKSNRLYSSFGFCRWMLRFGFMPAHPAAFIKKSAYDKVGPYSIEYKIAGDFDWFVRAFLVHGLSYVKVNSVMVRMREGGISTSGLKSYWLTSKEQVDILKKNNVYSNVFFVLSRLPLKFFKKIFYK